MKPSPPNPARPPRLPHRLTLLRYVVLPLHVLERGSIGARDVPALDVLRPIGDRSVRLSRCERCGLLRGEWWEEVIHEGKRMTVFAFAVGLEVEALAVCTSMPACDPLHPEEAPAIVDGADGSSWF